MCEADLPDGWNDFLFDEILRLAMCRLVLLCLYLMCVGVTSYAEEREVVFRIDGEATSVEEFAHYYARIHAVNGISTEHFLPHFLYYKLKVADAKKQGWDTLPDFRLQCSVLQNEMGRERESRALKSVPMKWVKFRQISILLPQHVSAIQERQARQRMDSVYAALKEGADFEALARNYSSEASASSPYADGEWIPEVCLVKEFSEQLDALKKMTFPRRFSLRWVFMWLACWIVSKKTILHLRLRWPIFQKRSRNLIVSSGSKSQRACWQLIGTNVM